MNIIYIHLHFKTRLTLYYGEQERLLNLNPFEDKSHTIPSSAIGVAENTSIGRQESHQEKESEETEKQALAEKS